MTSMTRTVRCPCGHPTARGTHERCHARLLRELVRERYGQMAELERERVRPRIPRPRAGAR